MTSRCPHDRIEIAVGFLYGQFERGLLKVPKLGIQALEKILIDGFNDSVSRNACRYLADYYDSVGNMDLQEKYLQLAVDSYGCFSSAYNLALVVEKNHRYQEAVNWYRKAIKLSPFGS